VSREKGELLGYEKRRDGVRRKKKVTFVVGYVVGGLD
jgi:hypothetical protein